MDALRLELEKDFLTIGGKKLKHSTAVNLFSLKLQGPTGIMPVGSYHMSLGLEKDIRKLFMRKKK